MDMNIQIFWGVKGIDKNDTSMWDPEKIGKVIFDEHFDLSPPEA